MTARISLIQQVIYWTCSQPRLRFANRPDRESFAKSRKLSWELEGGFRPTAR